MNIFSNIGITELLVILLLALLVVGPERLPEMGRTLAKTLRDVRKAYENLTKDLGPELMSLQETTQELRESVESITSIPQDMIGSVVSAADLDDTIGDLKRDLDSLQEVGRTVSGAGKMIKDPVGAAVDTARGALLPPKSDGLAKTEEPAGEAGAAVDPAPDAALHSEPDEPVVAEAERDSKEPAALDTAPKAAPSSQPAEPIVVEAESETEESSEEVEGGRGEREERSDD